MIGILIYIFGVIVAYLVGKWDSYLFARNTGIRTDWGDIIFRVAVAIITSWIGAVAFLVVALIELSYESNYSGKRSYPPKWL